MREKRDLLCASICDQRIPEITGDDSVNSCTSSFVTRSTVIRSVICKEKRLSETDKAICSELLSGESSRE